MNAVFLANFDQTCLLQIRMIFNLVDDGLDSRIGQEIEHILAIEVTDTDVLGISLSDALFHVFPDIADLPVGPFALPVEPQCWDVQVVQVDVFEVERGQGLFEFRYGVLIHMIERL